MDICSAFCYNEACECTVSKGTLFDTLSIKKASPLKNNLLFGKATEKLSIIKF